MRPVATALLVTVALVIGACGSTVGATPILEVELLADRRSLLISTVCAAGLSARVIEAETEIVVTLAGEPVDDDCTSSVAVVLEGAAGTRFVRDGASGTVFGWDGASYLRLPPP